MFKENSKQFKDLPNKSRLDQFLWLIENYFPQKKDRRINKKLHIHNLEEETIRKFSKLPTLRSKTLFPAKKNMTISFTFGNWALPYLKFLKKLGIAK